jgi:hypothetical protein
MKIKFSRAVSFVPDFNKNKELPVGEQIKCKLTVLNLAELAFVGEIIAKLGITKDNAEGIAMNSDVLKDMAKDLSSVLTAHVTIENLEDESGPVKIDDLPSLAPYMTLALEQLVELASISAPGEADRKNSKEPSV